MGTENKELCVAHVLKATPNCWENPLWDSRGTGPAVQTNSCAPRKGEQETRALLEHLQPTNDCCAHCNRFSPLRGTRGSFPFLEPREDCLDEKVRSE